MPRSKASKRNPLKRSLGLKNLEEGLENLENDEPQASVNVNQQMAWVLDETEDSTIPVIPTLEAGDFKRESTFIISPTNQRRKQRIARTKTIQADIEALSPIKHVQEIESLSNEPSPCRDRDDASSVSRLSADDSSVDGKSSGKPASRSYRDKIRDRIESVREKAVSSIVKSRAKKSQRSRLHSLTSQAEVDQTLREEESTVLEALERHEEVRSRWKEAAHGSKEIATADAAFDFFSQVWDDNEDQPAEPAVSPRSIVENIQDDEEGVKPTVSDYLGLQDEWETVEHVPATILHASEVQQREDKLYFRVSSKPVELERKLRPGCQLRDVELEGLFVGVPPAASERNLRRLEQRLVANNDVGWFGEDGRVLRSADPRTTGDLEPLPGQRGVKRAVVYRPATMKEPSRLTLSAHHPAVLALHVASLRFTHHALFGREHVLAQRLTELHRAYERSLEHRTVQRLGGRLEALRRARDALGHGDGSHRGKARYVTEISKTRERYQSAALADRELVKQLILGWQDMEKLRETQGYVSTPLKVSLVTVSSKIGGLDDTLEEEWAAWNERIEQEVREVLTEEQDRYNQELEEHTVERASWHKRRKALRKKSRMGGDAGDELAEDEPEPPALPDVKTIRQAVSDSFYRCFAPPGEPEIRVELGDGEAVDAKPANNKEVQRRAAVKRSSVVVKILFNRVEVCRSKPYPIGAKFSVAINQVMQIQIDQWPESLVVQVIVSSPGSQLTVEVFVPLPSRQTTLANAVLDWLSFSSSQVQTASHAGVGAGVAFSELISSETKSTCLYTSGEIGCRVGWGVSDIGEVMAPPDIHGDDELEMLPSMLDADGPMDVDKLTEWVAKSQLDPNDPRNAAFFHLLDTAPRSRRDADCFRLDPLNREFDFCSAEEMDANPRLRLLRLRDMQEPEFRALKLVPCLEREIDKDIFKKYNERREMPDESRGEPLSLVDAHRARGRRFLLEVRQRVLAQCRVAQQHRTLQDIVLEDQVLAISTLGLTFMKWLQPKRPLRPKRRERKKVAVQNLAGQEVKVSVNVVRAFEVPVRKDADPVPVDSGPFPAVVAVRPFVEVSFQGVVARTTAADGANPTWNQDLQLPLRPPSGDFSPGRLQEIQDCLYLHLFDETVVDLLEDDRMRETNVHQRLERHWLGSLSIPFSTLYHNSRIEGTFKLYSPPVLLGYEREPQHRRFNGQASTTDTPMQRDATFLTLFVTVQPALNPPEPFKERLESSELEYVERHLDKWQAEMAALFPRRPVKTLVLDSSGKTLCVTRFFRPLQPPDLDPEHEMTEEMAARFVSMIPSVPGSVLFPGLFDVWLTSQQVLGLLGGDCQDLAVLLCCYLSHLHVKAWLLLGAGIPHGPSAYVLTRTGEHRSEHEFFIWDPVAGQRYSLLDSFCPLRKVWCVVNEDNIWANVQREESPQRTRFDLSMKSDWCAAFGRGVGAPNGSVQLPALEYRQTSVVEAQRLQDKLEKHLRDRLARWRRTETTLWNRYCVSILRKLLPTLEAAALVGAANAKSPTHAAELHHVLASHKMCGFPINMPYTTVSAITEAVKATGVHRNETVDVEFALAVHVHPFPSNVLSVWVYVAALTRRR